MSPCFCVFNLAASCVWAKDSSLNKGSRMKKIIEEKGDLDANE